MLGTTVVLLAGIVQGTPDLGTAGLPGASGLQTGRRSLVVQRPRARHPIRGQQNAGLNIIYWAPFRSDYTRRAQPFLNRLLAKYRGRLRLQFMNLPRLGRYWAAERYAARAAREVFIQGGHRMFWRFHDELLKLRYMYRLTTTHVDKSARLAGANLARMKRAIQAGLHDRAIEDERALATRLGISQYQSYPVLLIGSSKFYLSYYRSRNFRYVEATVLRELNKVAGDAQRVSSPLKLHALQLERAKKLYRPYRGRSYLYRRQRRSRRYQLPVRGSPTRGSATALVTITAFVDFGYSSSRYAWLRVLAAQKRHPRRVRLVVKMLPRRWRYSRLAAEASQAAHAQGRFWEFAKVALQRGGYLRRHQLSQYARQAGLDVQRFLRDFRSPRIARRIMADQRLASKVGVRYAPFVFINGRKPHPTSWNQPAFDRELKVALKGGLLTRLLGD